MGSGELAVQATRKLSEAQFSELSSVPPEVEWFAKLTNANTRRA
jgi:hypothetical protein